MINRILIIAALAFISMDAKAQFISPDFDTQGEAFVACQAGAAHSTEWQAQSTGYTHSCILDGTGWYLCVQDGTGNSVGCPRDHNDGGGGYAYRWVTGEWCSAQPNGSQIYDSQEPAVDCVNGCQYEATTGSCMEDGLCLFNVEPNGGVCNQQPTNEPDEDLPTNCIRNNDTGAVACDCGVDPNQAWCQVPPDNPPDPLPPNCISGEFAFICTQPGSDPPGDGGGSSTGGGDPNDDTDHGGGQTPGDGDPDTPSGPGTGTGDVDGDGDRDIDCNPFSNPDCAFQGSAQSKGNCAGPPSCTGDPVQCAQLVQIWQLMCYGEDKDDENTSSSVTGIGSCSAPPECDGDAVMCAIVLSDWHSQCVDLGEEYELEDLAEGTNPLDTANDEIIDLSTELDSSGFLGGGSCPPDLQMNLLGHSIEVDMQPFCDIGSVLAVLVLVGAGMRSAWIVFT